MKIITYAITHWDDRPGDATVVVVDGNASEQDELLALWEYFALDDEYEGELFPPPKPTWDLLLEHVERAGYNWMRQEHELKLIAGKGC